MYDDGRVSPRPLPTHMMSAMAANTKAAAAKKRATAKPKPKAPPKPKPVRVVMGQVVPAEKGKRYTIIPSGVNARDRAALMYALSDWTEIPSEGPEKVFCK